MLANNHYHCERVTGMKALSADLKLKGTIPEYTNAQNITTDQKNILVQRLSSLRGLMPSDAMRKYPDSITNIQFPSPPPIKMNCCHKRLIVIELVGKLKPP